MSPVLAVSFLFRLQWPTGWQLTRGFAEGLGVAFDEADRCRNHVTDSSNATADRMACRHSVGGKNVAKPEVASPLGPAAEVAPGAAAPSRSRRARRGRHPN
jgi:hypothetical protein